MDALAACLANSLSSEQGTRQGAEVQLKESAYASNDPLGTFGVNLARAFASDALLLPVRQAAGIALKKYVYERWSIYFDEYLRDSKAADAVGEAGAVPEEAKHAVHLSLLSALGDTERKIRLLAAQLLSIVGSCDFPDQFPELLPALQQNLYAYSAQDPRAAEKVHGAMKFLSDFVQVELDENQLLVVARQFIPLLQEILSDPSGVLSPHTKARCLLVFRQCLTSLYTVRDAYASVVTEAVNHYLPSWLDAMHTMLDPMFYVQADWRDGASWEVLGLRREILRTLSIASRFRKQFSPHAGVLYATSLANLDQLAPLFTQVELAAVPVYEEPDAPEGDVDVATSLARLAMAILHLFSDVLESSAMRALLLEGGAGGDGDATPALAQLVHLLTIYAQITREDEATFEDDPSAFVDEDDEENILVTLRTSTADVLDQLLDAYPLPVLRTLPVLLDEIQRAPCEDPIWWKWPEAALMLVGNTHHLIEEVRETVGDAHALQPARVVQAIAVPYMAPDAPSFLRGRSFVFASQFVSELGVTFGRQVWSEAMQVLHASDAAAPLHVKLSAVRAVRNLAQFSESVHVDDARALVQQLGPLLLRASGSPLILIVDALDAALKASFSVQDAPVLIEVGRAALVAWRAHAGDPQAEISLAALLETLVQQPHGAEAIVCLALDAAAEALSAAHGSADGATLGASAASLARSVLTAAAPALLGPVAGRFFSAAAHFLVRAEDMEASHSLLFALAVLWQKRPAELLAWREGDLGALEVVLQIVQQQLQSDAEGAIGMPLGVLLLTLLLQASAQGAAMAELTAVLPGLVQALAAKLVATRATDAVMALLLPLQYLFAEHTPEVLSLLAQTPLSGGDALRLVVAVWLDHAEMTIGRAVGNLNLVALAQLYTHWPPALDTLEVRGEVRATHTHVIQTRSKARSAELYERKPARVRLAELLAQAFQAQEDVRTAAADRAAAVEPDADDAWEDDEEANAANAARDARLFAGLDEVLDWGLEEEEEGVDDPPYLAPVVALPAFARIYQWDRPGALAAALQQTPPTLAAALPLAAQEALAAAHAYAPP